MTPVRIDRSIVKKKNSFDLVRIIAALMVMVSHSFALTGSPEPQLAPGYSLGRIGVDAFFALSGYLVFQSLDRDPHLFRFLAKRGLRIFPGLAVMLLMSVCVLGPLFSTLTADDYFFHSNSWNYLRKIKLWGSDQLPGVFESNPYPNTVNGSLWSLKLEWLMYCILGGVALIGRALWRSAIVGLSIVFGSLALITGAHNHAIYIPFLSQLPSSQNPFMPGSFFFFGSLFSLTQLGKAIRFAPPIYFLIVTSAFGVLMLFGGSVATQIALWLLIPALIVGVGESDLSGNLGLNIRNDISYGLYIYAFPIQQSVVALWEGVSWWESLLFAVPLTAGIAFLSWIIVEKPALKLKLRLRSGAIPEPMHHVR